MGSPGRYVISIAFAVAIANIGHAYVQPSANPVRFEENTGNLVVEGQNSGSIYYITGTVNNATGATLGPELVRINAKNLNFATVYRLVPVMQCPKPGECHPCKPNTLCPNPPQPAPPFSRVSVAGNVLGGFVVPK
jgi:hypothetical protein